MEPVVDCTFESTKVDPPEAVKIVWVTGEDDPEDRTIMVGHDGGVAVLSMEQWRAWCERVGAKIWDEDLETHPAFRSRPA